MPRHAGGHLGPERIGRQDRELQTGGNYSGMVQRYRDPVGLKGDHQGYTGILVCGSPVSGD